MSTGGARVALGIVGKIFRMIDWKSNKSRPEQAFYEPENKKRRTDTTMNNSTCLCKCGEATGKKANYKPGHDARHFAAVAREIAANPRRRASLLSTLPSPALRAKAERAADRLGTKITKEAAA